MWNYKTVCGVLFSWLNGKLVSILYNNGKYRTTFDVNGNFYQTTIQDGNVCFEYFHISGNEFGSLFSVSDEYMVVTESELRVTDKSVLPSEYNRRKRKYVSMIKMQLCTEIPEEVVRIVKGK